MEKREALCSVGKNVNGADIMENRVVVPKKKKNNYHMIQQFHFWVFIWRKQKHQVQKIHTP